MIYCKTCGVWHSNNIRAHVRPTLNQADRCDQQANQRLWVVTRRNTASTYGSIAIHVANHIDATLASAIDQKQSAVY